MEGIEISKKIQFGLRNYQKDATEHIDKVFSSEDYNRYAAVILPTGGGKSFVAIQELLSFNNPNYAEKNRNARSDKNGKGGINDAKMLYIAPTHEILSQIKLHIVKNVLFSIPDLEKRTIEEIDTIIKDEFPNLKFSGINSNLEDRNLPIIEDEASASEKKSGILRQITPKQIDALVRAAFPNLKFKCYAGVKGEKTDIKNQDIEEAEFCIVDEAHRLGASDWRPNFEECLSKNPNVKILGITATPERTDNEGRNMMAEIAKMVYPKQSITSDQYLAQEIYVADAIKDGIVVSPSITSTDATLAKSAQYLEILERYENTKDPNIKQEMDLVLKQMEEIIGFSPRELSEEEIQEKIDASVAATIAKDIRNPNGKYIAFLPANKSDPKSDQEQLDSAEFFLQYMEKIREQFKDVLGENGNPVEITFEIVTSNKSIRVHREGNKLIPTLDKNDEPIVNSQVIKNFEDASNETGGIKILLANNILNEGVHVDGIDGALMYRKIDSPITFLQQSGRCISSMDPKKPLEKQSKTQIIDTVGNTFYQVTNNNGRNISRNYDLRRMQEIVQWIKDNGNRIPDINKEAPENASNDEKVKAEYEARLAISLKRLKFRYLTIKNSGSLPLEDTEKINEILNQADSINLWDINFPIRTSKPSEEELTGEGFMELTPSQQKFMELYRGARQKVVEPTANTRVAKLLNILKVLKMHKPDIKLPQGLYFKPNHDKIKEMQSPDTKTLMLDDLLRQNFTPEEIKLILVEMQDYNLVDARNSGEIFHPGEEYDIGKEMAFVRGKLWTSQNDFLESRKNLFENVMKLKNPMKFLIETGLIENPMKDLEKINELNGEFLRITTGMKTIYGVKRYIDEHGRLKPDTRFDGLKIGLIQEFEECSLATGEKYFDNFSRSSGYDRFGFDKDGYDMYGYDRFGFNRDCIHKITGTNIDERGFYFDEKEGKYLNKLSNGEYDLLGYNIYGFNEEGFERPLGPKKTNDGRIRYKKPLWHQRNEDGTYNVHGYENVPALYSKIGEKSHDAHGYITSKKSLSNNPLLSSKRGKGKFFLPSGATRTVTTAKKAYPLGIDDFYLEQEKVNGKSYQVDIDGFDRNGYKRVKIDEKDTYIHRDTSSIYDKKGRICDEKTLEPKDDISISNSKQIIAILLSGENMNIDRIYQLYAGCHEISVAEAQEEISKILDKGFEIYQTYSPNAFDEDNKCSPPFKGLEEYYRSHSFSTEKRARINQLFEICPRARTILENQCEVNMEMLQVLEEKEKKSRAQGNKTPELTEQETKRILENKQEVYRILSQEDDDQR